MATQPDFKVSDATKRKEDWYKNAVDWLIDKATSSNNKSKTRDAIRAANGLIDTTEFTKVMQPFSSIGEEIKNLPGTIREVDFITPIREKNIGEYIILPYKYFVTVENPDVIISRDTEVADQIFKELQKTLVAYVESLQQGKEPQQIDPQAIKDKADEFKQQFFDDKVIQAQHILDFINEFNDFEYKRINAFSDWWMTEEIYTYRYIRNGELFKEVLDVLNSYPIPNNSDFVEDYDGFVYKQRITFQEFEQYYADKLTAEEYKYLKNITYNSSAGGYTVPITILQERGNLNNINYITGTNNFVLGNESLDLWRVHFVAQSPVIELTYSDPMGRVQTMHVDNKYILNPDNGDISLKSIWIPKVYEAYRFGNNTSGVYVAPEPCLVQRYDDRANTVKLPVGGKKGLLRGIPINPIPLRLKDYLILDRILLLAIERSIAKFKADLITMPQSVLNPDKAGTTKEKYQHMLADDMLIFDETKVDLQTVIQGIRSIARSSISQYIETLWRLRQMNKQEALDAANMNQERLGNMAADQTATGGQNNLAYAKLGSVLMITVFNKMLEKDHVADMEFSKFAYINGKQATYFDRQSEEYIELTIDPIEHYYNKYGINVSNSKVHDDIMNEFKRMAFSAAQNGDFSMASTAITASTPKEISRTIDKLVAAKEEYERSIREQELAIQSEANQLKAGENQLALTLQDMKDKTNIEVAQISAGAKVMTSPSQNITPSTSTNNAVQRTQQN